MSNKKQIVDIDMFDCITVNDAIAQGLVRLTSDLPMTNGDLSRRVEQLVRDTQLQYSEIVDQIRSEFPHARTTTKSVASVACVMRQKGVPVPYRLKLHQ